MLETISQEQQRLKPLLEDAIKKCLSEESQRSVLAFLNYCKLNKISYAWSSTNKWYLKAKGKRIGIIWIGEKYLGKVISDKDWYIGIGYVQLFPYDDFVIKESLQSGIVEKLVYCSKYKRNCGASCSPGETKIIFNYEYRNLCAGMWILDNNTCISYKNPDYEMLNKVKRIIDFIIDNSTTKKEPLTEDIVIGSRKISAVEFRKFFKKTLGEDYEKHPVVRNVIKLSASYKGKTLKAILDEVYRCT